MPPWIIVPGWGGSGADHWQTRWADAGGAVRVELADWYDPKRDAWLAAIESAFTLQSRRDPRPPVIIAHSLGCIAVAEWARTTPRAVRAAFLVAPADVDRTECASMFHDFQPLPRTPLPFRSLVVTSDNDPHVTLARAEDLAVHVGERAPRDSCRRAPQRRVRARILAGGTRSARRSGSPDFSSRRYLEMNAWRTTIDVTTIASARPSIRRR